MNNAEISPGFPKAEQEVYSILYAPVKCADGEKVVKDRCRKIL